jgi:RND family efflux transporter MFP subunit
MARAYRTLLLIFAAAACAVSGGCRGATASVGEAKPPKVTVSHPTYERITDEESYTGWLRASAKVDVRARVRGHIEKVDFRDGDLVKRGQLLFELDPRPFQTQIDQARAQAKAVAAQKVSLQKDVDRYRELIKSKAVSEQQLDQAVADLGYADAQLAAKNEEVKSRMLDLEYSKITSPIAGRTGRAMLTEGNLVNAGGSDPILTTVIAVNPLSLYFSVDEPALQNYLKAAADQDKSKPAGDADKPLRERKLVIRFKLDTDDGYPHTAILDFANNELDSSTGTIELRAEVDNSKGLFSPGYAVGVRVPTSNPYDAMMVPEEAVNTDQDRKFLLVVDSKGIVKRCDVKLGRLLDNGMQVVVSSAPALAKDSQIIIEGMQRARINYPVEPILQSSAAEAAAASELSRPRLATLLTGS